MTVKDNSYRVRRELPPGSHASITRRIDRYGETALVPGDIVLIRSYSNAGFRGIEAHVQDMYGRDWYGVPAGILSAE